MRFAVIMLAIYVVGAVLIFGFLTNQDARDWVVRRWPELGANGR